MAKELIDTYWLFKNPNKAVIYISSSDQDQANEHLKQLRKLGDLRRYKILNLYQDIYSDQRPQLQQLLLDCQKGEFNFILCTSVKNFFQCGILEAYELIEYLISHKVVLISLKEEIYSAPGVVRQVLAPLIEMELSLNPPEEETE